MEPANPGGVPDHASRHGASEKVDPISIHDFDCSGERIAIIGAGATGTYMLEALTRVPSVREIVVFEDSRVAGPGLAYAETLNDPHALSNIAGIEIPPLVEGLNEWAVRQPQAKLEAWGIVQSAGDQRAFFPRVVLGVWLADQFNLVAERTPVPVSVNLRADVVDVVAMPDGCRIDWRGDDGAIVQVEFDRVIIATGYGPTEKGKEKAAQRTGKAAADAAQDHSSTHIGILGSSLSGIDAVIATALARGDFVQRDGILSYLPKATWRATMLSRNGLLPEADFWFPHPLPDLEGFTPATAAAGLRGENGDLDRLFVLFADALQRHDPKWAKAIGLADATADDFADRSFAARVTNGPWAHARQNLADVREWQANHLTTAWRTAILKAHEVFATVIPQLSPEDLVRFHVGLKRVFTDNYAAVPHLSIERILALHDAGVLDVVALGKVYDILPQSDRSWVVRSPAVCISVDDLIDARGPQAAALDHFPFPTLRLQLCAHAIGEGLDWNGGLNPAVDHTVGEDDLSLSRVHLCALPFLLRNRPFVQGLVECAQMARAVARSILNAYTTPKDITASAKDLIELLNRPSSTLSDGAVITLAGVGETRSRDPKTA